MRPAMPQQVAPPPTPAAGGHAAWANAAMPCWQQVSGKKQQVHACITDQGDHPITFHGNV